MFVKDIIERDSVKPTEPAAPRPPVAQARGFPVAAHRSKGGSAFARARKDQATRAAGGLSTGEGRVVDKVPSVGLSTSSIQPPASSSEEVESSPAEERDAVSLPALTEAEQVRRQVHLENVSVIEAMSPAEREQEAEELRERFGDDVVALMRRRRAAREASKPLDPSASSSGLGGSGLGPRDGAGPRLIKTPKGMGVFEGGAPGLGVGGGGMGMGGGEGGDGMRDFEPENARKVMEMSADEREEEMRDLEERFGSALLGRLKTQLEKRDVGRMAAREAVPEVSEAEAKAEPKEPRTEAVKRDSTKPVHEHPTEPRAAKKSVRFDAPTPTQLRRYFPDAPSSDPKLEWMGMANPAAATLPQNQGMEEEDVNAPRFDLSGTLLSAQDAAKLPTHLGLHHHGASPDLAGYTLGEITHLCYSTVASQRIAMMAVLGRVVRNYRRAIDVRSAEKERAKKEGQDPVEWEDGETEKPMDWVDTCTDQDVEGKALSVASSVLSSPTRAISVVAAAADLLFTALGGPWPYLDSPPVRFHPEPSRGGEATGVAALAWDDLSPRLAELLSTDLPPSTLNQLLRILRRTAVASPQLAEAITPILPHVVKALILRPAWPVVDGKGPNLDALALLREVIESSREAAEALVPSAESLLKFLATGVPEDRASRGVVLDVLRILYALGRYGMAASLAASAREVWRRLGEWVAGSTSSSTVNAEVADEDEDDEDGEVEEEEVEGAKQIYIAYFDLLRVWTVCAIDPHRTTPEHDLTWSQATALGIYDEALSATRSLIPLLPRAHGNWARLASTLTVLSEYALGVGINGVRAGADEKNALLAALNDMGLIDAIPNGLAYLPPPESGFNAALTEVFKLNNALNFDLVVGPPRERLVWWLIATTNSTDVHLRHALLGTARHDGVVNTEMWARSAFDLALNFMPGDEPLALALVDDLLRADWGSLEAQPQEEDEEEEHDHEHDDEPDLAPIIAALKAIGHADGLHILRPLLHQSVLPSLSDILAPTRPAHLYLKASGTLRPPAHSTTPQGDGLPLSDEWVFSPLDALLSSSLALAPSDWDASEPQVARASLALARLAAALSTAYRNRSVALLGCMKVFMLEHGQQDDPNTVSDVFRDEGVQLSLTAILDGISKPEAKGLKAIKAPLEGASKPFLGATPFFQFYQDLVALFEAVSFGDAAFARTLLPPLAMTYDVDYRRLLWAESGALRSVRLPESEEGGEGEVPLESDDVGVYFHPLESDRGVLAAYARALVSGTVSRAPFLVRVACHHLAGLLWTGEEEERSSPRVQLLVVLLAQGSDDVIKLVLAHDVEQRDGCGVVGEEEVQKRVGVAAKLAGPRAVARLEAAGYTVQYSVGPHSAADIGCMALYKAALSPLGAAASLPHLARLILHEGSVGLQLRTNAVLISKR